MNHLNSCVVEGNLVRDPLLRTTPAGTPVCTMTIESNRFYKTILGIEKEVSYFDVETWAKLAESCHARGRKGKGIRVVGRMKQERWTGIDGRTLSKIIIVAEHVEFRPELKSDKKTNKEKHNES